MNICCSCFGRTDNQHRKLRRKWAASAGKHKLIIICRDLKFNDQELEKSKKSTQKSKIKSGSVSNSQTKKVRTSNA